MVENCFVVDLNLLEALPEYSKLLSNISMVILLG